MADKTLKVYLFSSILNINQNGKTNLNKGYVTQIIGPVLDIKFSEGNLPPIYSAPEFQHEAAHEKRTKYTADNFSVTVLVNC
jgi:hypothetical protein